MFTNRGAQHISNKGWSLIRQSWDASAFAGRVVAFKTTSIYFGIGKGYTFDCAGTRYGLIDRQAIRCSGELGFHLHVLLAPQDTHSFGALINSKLKNANMQIRLATKEEINLIKDAISKDKAWLELIDDKKEVILNELDEHIKEFDTKFKAKSL